MTVGAQDVIAYVFVADTVLVVEKLGPWGLFVDLDAVGGVLIGQHVVFENSAEVGTLEVEVDIEEDPLGEGVDEIRKRPHRALRILPLSTFSVLQ